MVGESETFNITLDWSAILWTNKLQSSEYFSNITCDENDAEVLNIFLDECVVGCVSEGSVD